MKERAQFSLPEKGEIFTDLVLDRCKSLSAARVWEELSPLRLDTWMNNFVDPLERYFAACVMDALIYRSRRQTIALMEQLFQRSIVDLVRRSSSPLIPSGPWLEILASRSTKEDPQIRLVPVLRPSDPPTKSGPVLARLYRQHFGFNDKWMIWPWAISEAKASGTKVFIFIDDFLGTSQQFQDFANQFDLAHQLEGAYPIYAPLVAHQRGLTLLKDRLSYINVCSAEVLDDTHSLFARGSRHFSDGVNSPPLALRYYQELLRRKQILVSHRFKMGYGRLALAYSFQHATPNNCLPLLWMPFPNWEPLFER